MSHINTLTTTKFDKRGRLYVKNHILDGLDIEPKDQFEVWVDIDSREILLKPYKNGYKELEGGK